MTTTADIIKFPAKPDETDVVDWTARRQNRRRPNMHSFVFRSLKLILESDETDLVRDVRLDMDKAEKKLNGIRQRLVSVQEQAAAQVQTLTAAEARLAAAIDGAKNPEFPTVKDDAYRDLLAAFGKLDRRGQRSVVCYLATQV